MKTFAVYDKDGKITKVISTTREDVIEKNVPKDHEYIEVASNVKTTSHQIVDGEAIKQAVVAKQRVFTKPKIPVIDPKSIITSEEIDACKSLDEMKTLLKKMIAPQVIGKVI